MAFTFKSSAGANENIPTHNAARSANLMPPVYPTAWLIAAI
jgi:hypothetical protein